MTETALFPASQTHLPNLSLAEDESLCEKRAVAWYNGVRSWVEMYGWSRWLIVGYILIACAWINHRFWSAWQQVQAQNGRPTHGQWIAMILYGQFARPFTLFFGKVADQSIEKRRSALPKDHAHALPIADARLRHLSLIGIPVTMTVGGDTEIVEFAVVGGEIHVRAGDTAACVWFVQADDGNTITMTNVQEPVTDIVRRNGCIEVCAGNHSTHLRDDELASILDMLQDGTPDIMSSQIEYTSIANNAAQTVRFELLL